MKVWLSIVRAVTNDFVIVAIHSSFLPWRTWSDTATGSVVSVFSQFVLGIMYAKVVLFALAASVTSPLRHGVSDGDPKMDKVRPACAISA